MDNFPKWMWIVVLVVVVGGGWYIFNQDKSAAIEGPVRVGVMLPMTGDAAVYGEPLLKVAQLALEEVNAAGGVNGQPMEFIIEDSKCDGALGATVAQKFINVDKVQIIFGELCSSATLSAVPVAESAKVALFSATASSPELTDISDYFVRNYPSDSAQGSILAEVAYQDKGWRTVAFVQEQTDYAQGLYDAFTKRFTELGGTTTNDAFATETTDFRSVVTKIQGQAPDAVFLSVQTPAAAARILSQMGQVGYAPALLISDTIAGDPATVSANAVALEGALAAEFAADPANPKFAALVSAYEAEHGTLPYQGYASTVYDAVYLLRDAVAAVGYDGTKVAQWLRGNVKDWVGASGTITIGSDGDLTTGHRAEVVMDGKIVPYVK